MPPDPKPELCWQEKAGESWVRLQTQTDAQLGPLGQLVMERLQVRPGERVLDVGCGAGQTLLDLGELVGAEGRVTGLDISEPLLNRARERIHDARLSNVNFVLGDAGTQTFDEPYDVCFSRFGVMFFEDSVAGFRNLCRSLRDGGRLGFVCWQGRDKNDWASLLLDAIRTVLPEQSLPEMFEAERPGPFRFADAERLRAELESAGFQDVVIEPIELEVHLGGAMTLDEAVDFSLEIGPAARMAAEADKSLVPQFRAALAAALAPKLSARGVWLGAAIYVVTARV